MSSPRNFSTNDVRMGLRRRLQVFLDDPNSSKYAVAFALFIAFMVMLSSISVIIESLPHFYEHESKLWWQFETITLVIFSSELALRCFAHSTSWKQFNRFFWSFSNFIDIIAIAPVFIEVVLLRGTGKDTKRFMVFRLFRLIRLLHCYGYSSVLQLSMDAMFIALKKSKDALLAILFFQFFVIIIFSTLIYFFERGTMENGKFMMDGKPSKFDSIPATFWFVAEVITTVGLGDVYPRTVPGKLLSFPLMLFGLLIIALPSIVLGKNFAEAWLWLKTSGNIQKQAMLQAKMQKEQREKGKKKSAKLPSSKKQALKGSEEQGGGSGDPIMTARDFAKEFEEEGPVKQKIQKSSEFNHQKQKPPEYSTAIDMDRIEKGGNEVLVGEDEEEQKQRENEEANEETNNETVRSGDQAYFVSPEALIESENQSEILQLVQMLVEQFQHNSQVMERLARQQENLVGTVAMLKKTQQRIAKQQGISGIMTGGVSSGEEYNLTSDERSRSRSRSRRRSSRSRSRTRSRSRDRSRNRSRDRSRSRSHDRSRSRSRSKGNRSDSSRGRSRSKSIIRLTRSRSRSPSPRSETPRGRSRGSQSRSRSRSRPRSNSGSRHRHRRRVSSCSTCEDR